MQELNHLCSGAQEVEQAGCEFSLTLALMANALNDNHRAVGGQWLGQHAHGRGQGMLCPPNTGHIARVRQSSLLQKAAGGCPRKITFHQKIASHQKCQGEQTSRVLLGRLISGNLAVCWIFFSSGKASSFHSSIWGRSGG